MAEFIKKQIIVEARQHNLETDLTVMNDEHGQQIAKKGDWLVGNERGKVSVVKAEKFAKEYEPYEAPKVEETTEETTGE